MCIRQNIKLFPIVLIIISSFCFLSKAQSQSGNLNVTVQNIDDRFISGASVVRFNSDSKFIDKRATGSNGVASWTDISVGTFYMEVYQNGNSLPYIGDEFWGKGICQVISGGTANVTIKRYEPYAQSIVFRNHSTNEILSYANPFPPNTTVRVEVIVKNIAAVNRTVKVELLIDRDKVSPYDFDLKIDPRIITANGNTYRFVTTFTPTAEGLYYRGLKTESYIDTGYNITDTWAWDLIDGSFKVDPLSDIKGQDENGQIPEHFALLQNYPNPFNPTTVISWRLAVSSFVNLKIYDLLGREVATFVDEFQQAGIHHSQFSILNYSLPSGIYFYKLMAGEFRSIKKMLLIK